MIPEETIRVTTVMKTNQAIGNRSHLGFLQCAWLTLALLVAGCAGSRTTFSKAGQASRLPQNHHAAKLPAFEPQPPRQARRQCVSME